MTGLIENDSQTPRKDSQIQHHLQKLLNLQSLFQRFGTMASSVKHDTIYALLGLVDKDSVFDAVVVEYLDDDWYRLQKLHNCYKIPSPLDFT